MTACALCGKDIVGRRKTAVYCSPACQQKAAAARFAQRVTDKVERVPEGAEASIAEVPQAPFDPFPSADVASEYRGPLETIEAAVPDYPKPERKAPIEKAKIRADAINRMAAVYKKLPRTIILGDPMGVARRLYDAGEK